LELRGVFPEHLDWHRGVDTMEDASGSRAGARAHGIADGNGGVQRWRGAVVMDLQRRVAGAQNWLGVAVQEGTNTVARFGQAVEERREMIAQSVEKIGKKGRGAGKEVENAQLAWEKKLWMRLSGFGAQVQRTMAELPEAMMRMVRSQGATPRPLMAALSLGLPVQGEGVEGKHVFDIAMSAEQVAKRLDGVPVYTVSNSSNEFVLISDLNTSKSLGIFCFRETDAEALLSQVFAVY
jgi:hypothetical protein